MAAGLDYIGIGPELADLADIKRVEFTRASDKEALNAVEVLAKSEGMIAALESAHAVAEGPKTSQDNEAKPNNSDQLVRPWRQRHFYPCQTLLTR